MNQPNNQSTYQSNTQPISQPINRSINQTVNQLIEQPINQPIKQSINRSFIQLINQSMHQTCFWVSFKHVLGIIQKCFWHHSDMFWGSSRHNLGFTTTLRSLEVYFSLQIRCWRRLGRYFRVQNRVFGVSLGSKIGSWKHLGTQKRLMMAVRSSRNSFLDYFGDPSLAKSMFLFPMEANMEPKWSLKSTFIAIENDDGKTMLYREGSASFQHRSGWDFGFQQRRDLGRS